MEWIIASRSEGKLAELVPILASYGISGIGLAAASMTYSAVEDDIERFDTFDANALAKAQYFAQLSGVPCVADDSGLCIDALDGRPGVRSRRFASDLGVRMHNVTEDTANNRAMLDACWDSGWAPPWAAHYACCAAYADAGGTCVAFGRTDGAIVPESEGAGGFGYDPHFMSDDLRVTFATASREAKARVSHRGRAFANLLTRMQAMQFAASAR